MRPADYTNYGLARELGRIRTYVPELMAEAIRRLMLDPYSTPKQFSDAQRLDWLDRHRSTEHDSDNKEHWVVAWLSQDEPGNSGCSGRFVARAATFRDCVDMFLRGGAVRID